MGSAKHPTIKSAAAKFATRKLNGDRRFRLGSIMTARSTRKLPVTVVAVRTEQNVAEVMLNSVGAEIFAHGYKPIKDIAPSIRPGNCL